jgi:hypothetical protein
MEFEIEQIELGDPALRAFVQVPWALFRGDPNWTPPLRAELLGNRLFRITGLLSKEHPYHETAEVTHFLARSEGTPRAGDDAGRAAVFAPDELPELAFDHRRIIDEYLRLLDTGRRPDR